MYDSGTIVDRINTEFLKATSRGVTLLGATGDGGSHFSFGAFPNDPIGTQLNGISCANALPTFPAESPYGRETYISIPHIPSIYLLILHTHTHL